MANSHVIRLVQIGGNLTVTIPVQLARELGWARRDYVRIFRSGARALTLTPAEVQRRDNPDLRTPGA